MSSHKNTPPTPPHAPGNKVEAPDEKVEAPANTAEAPAKAAETPEEHPAFAAVLAAGRHLTSADILGPGRASLSAVGQALLADIDAEVQVDIDAGVDLIILRDAIRPRLGGFSATLQSAAAALEPGAPDELPAFVFAYEEGRTDYLAASKAYGAATSSIQVYSTAAKVAAVAALVEIRNFKEKLRGRVKGRTPAEEAILQKGGIGDNPGAGEVGAVARVGNSQLDLLADPAALELMRHQGVYPERSLARLVPLMKTLDAQIDAGVGTDPRRADAAVKVNHALVKIQVVLSRAVVFFREFGAIDQANLLESQFPKRPHHRRSTDPTPPEPDPTPAPAPGTKKDETSESQKPDAKPAKAKKEPQEKGKGEEKK